MILILANALLPFRRSRADPASQPSTLPATIQTPPPVALLAPAVPIPTMSSEPSLTTKVLKAMLTALENFLPPAPLLLPPLPAPSLSLVGFQERTVGLGQRVGTDFRGPFSVEALKGIRLEAVVRYQVWATTSPDADLAIQDLIQHILGDRDLLRAAGFLRLSLSSTSASENVAENTWRETADFTVLYEFPFVDSDGADSLIAQIPINIDSEFAESTTVSDEMGRWDNLSAPPLVLRGRSSIGGLSALAFIPGNVPGGAVTLRRTFDGAQGAPIAHLTLASFLAAVAGANPAERHAEMTFASLTDFLAALASFKITEQALNELSLEGVPNVVLGQLRGIKDQEVAGEEEFLLLLQATIGAVQTGAFKAVILKHAATSKPTTMGDWNEDSLPDTYQSVGRAIEPPISLPSVADRFEITYQITIPNPDPVVVYLRATRGLTT